MNTTQEARKRKAEEAHELADKVITAFYEKLKAKLTERGHIFEVDEKGRPRKVDKVNLYFSATKERGRGYGQPISGKIRVEFGSYPNSKKFFQSKARGGDFDYEAIADEVKIRIAGAKERAEKLRRERAVEAEAIAIRNHLVREFYSLYTEGEIKDEFTDAKGPYVHTPEGADVQLTPSAKGLTIEFKKPLTEGQLREILGACKKVGLI